MGQPDAGCRGDPSGSHPLLWPRTHWVPSAPHPPCTGLSLQLDTEYRKKWDSLVIKLDVIERDLATGSEVIHWVTHFPVSSPFLPSLPEEATGAHPCPFPPQYPMYSRDYVYVRRYSVDQENNLMVLVSRYVSRWHMLGAGRNSRMELAKPQGSASKPEQLLG